MTERRLLLAGLVAICAANLGCAQLSAVFDEPVIRAGESHCTSSDAAICASLRSVAATLHTPEMQAQIDKALK